MSTSTKQSGSRDAKRARFSAQQRKAPRGASPVVLIVGIAAVLLLIGGAAFALIRSANTPAAAATGLSDQRAAAVAVQSDQPAAAAPALSLEAKAATSGHAPYPLAVAESGAVRLALATFDDQKAHFYTYMHNGEPIEFFVLKSKDGVVRAALNACDVCFPAKKGYRQEGDQMVCNNCGNRFNSTQINEVRGGCNPSPLDRSVEGDTLVILVEDIVGGQSYFSF